MKPSAPLEMAQGGTLPRLTPSRPFHYFHFPRKWEVAILSDGSGVLVPVLDQLRLDPGISGVAQVGNGTAPMGDGTIAIAQREKAGWVRIPHEAVTAWGETQPDYCLRWQGAHGSAHEEAWMKLTPAGGGRVEREWDGDGYARWRASLVDRGIVKPITAPARIALDAALSKAVTRRRVNDRNAVAIANSEQFERKLRVLREMATAPKAVPAPPPAVVPASPPPDVLTGLQATLAQILQSQQTLAKGQQEQAARLAALETAPKADRPKADRPKSEKLKAEKPENSETSQSSPKSPEGQKAPESDLIE